jgi:hypothetical protein
MGKAGRIFCIAIPFALTLISLVFLVLVGLGQTNKDSNYLSNLYYFRANLTGASSDFRDAKHPANNQTDPAAKTADGNIQLYNYYTIGLWNYCAGNGASVDNSSLAFGQATAQKVDYCTGRQTRFAFDPESAWGLQGDVRTKFFSKQLDEALDKYQSGFSKVMGPLYILAAVFSRLGSVATTIAASVTATLAFVFAAVATAAYSVLVAALKGALHSQGIRFDLGPSMLIYMWLVWVASFVAVLFWSLSSCCCSGGSSSSGSRSKRGSKRSGKGGYENLGGESGYPMQTGGWSGQGAQAYGVGHHGAPAHGAHAAGAYEPYRHV